MKACKIIALGVICTMLASCGLKGGLYKDAAETNKSSS